MTGQPRFAYDIIFPDDYADHGDGWCGGLPRGLTARQWPRSRVNGIPMVHVWTLAVPADYRTKGSQFVALSLFQADDHVESEVEGVAEVIDEPSVTPAVDDAADLWVALKDYARHRHPMEQYLEDDIGGGWALVWLTTEEFNGSFTPLPSQEETVYPDDDLDIDTAVYERDLMPHCVMIILRDDDPNVGKAITAFPDEVDNQAYIPLNSAQGESLNLTGRFFGKTHFGGTSSPNNGEPSFSPFYIEFDQTFGHANLGGDGVAQIDLLNDKLNWGCS